MEAAAAVAAGAAVVVVANPERFGATYSYRRRYFNETLRLPDSVRALEILADHFLPFTKRRREELAALRDRFALVPHSLDVSLGSADGLDMRHVAAVNEVVRFARAAYWSEHVAFTRIGNTKLGHLAPLPFTAEAVKTVVRNIAAVQAVVDVPLLLENIAYPFYFGEQEFDEITFLDEISRATGSGILLDLSNLNSAALLRGCSVDDLLRRFDAGRVRQFHLAGGYVADGRYVDSHDREVGEASWRILDGALSTFAPQAIVIERDDGLPPFAEIEAEIDRANAAWNMVPPCR